MIMVEKPSKAVIDALCYAFLSADSDPDLGLEDTSDEETAAWLRKLKETCKMTEEKLDDYYYARNHDEGPGAWCVRGPNGFQMTVPNLDKNVAYIIAKLLSENWDDAASMMATWHEFQIRQKRT